MKTLDKTKINSYLTYKLGDELYAANVKNVINIVAYPYDKSQKPQEKDLKVYYLDSQL